MKPTKANLIKILESIEEDEALSDVHGNWEEFLNLPFIYSSKVKEDPKILVVENLTLTPHAEYGGMGKGDEYWKVFKVDDSETNEESFWMVPGWYASHHGAELELDDLYRVMPVEVTTIEWQNYKKS